MPSPNFPPLQTVHETFISHGFPSIASLATDLRPSLHPHYRNIIAATSAFEYRFNCLSSSPAYLPPGRPDTFHRSDCPICAYILRCLLWARQLNQAYNLVWCFINCIFTPPHWLLAHFCAVLYGPVPSQVCQPISAFSP